MENKITTSPSTLIHGVSPEFIGSEFSAIRQDIRDLKQNLEPKKPEEYISRTKLSKKLDCDISSIHNWTKKGKLKAYGIGNRVYYKLSEVEAAIVPLNQSETV